MKLSYLNIDSAVQQLKNELAVRRGGSGLEIMTALA
jgi:hypothetical protein